MVKPVTQDIVETQEAFNEAFEHWKKHEDRKSWDTMFFLLLKVVRNVAKAMMKERAIYPSAFNEKSVDVVLNILRLYVLKKREPVRFLGSFVRGYIMNVFWKNYENKPITVERIEDFADTEYDTETIVEIQGRYFKKEKLVETIQQVVLPTQIKKIIENRV